MEDIAPKLIEAVTGEFRRLYEDSPKIQALLGKVREGTATYAEAQEYAIEVSRIIGQAYGRHVSSATLPDGRMYYNIASRLLPETLDENHRLISRYAADVQAALNKAAGIGLKAQTAELDEDRVDGLVEMVSNAEQYDEVADRLHSAIETFDQSIVDETIRKNADFHHRSGLSPKIVRKSSGKCCAWCRALVGIHSYPLDSNEVYRRHSNCQCSVLYDPADGSKTVQNVHSKQWTYGKDYDKLKETAMARPGFVKSNYNEKRKIQQGFEAFPEGDPLKKNIQQIKPDGDFFDVAMHGMPQAVCFGTKRASMDARELARIILRDSDYHPKQCVRLLSCSTGLRPPDGSYCVAEHLANILGVDVKAPNDSLYIFPDGSFFVGLMQDGEFVTFHPNQRGRVK